ncbi:pyridoxine 5'-phosphate synthase [Flavobacteriales bacterium]|jgi:pyridoxine 5-phosphate synthase|nr:pyridoxine 5'-phosphate synthase [Flavobacteriales bacterium]MDA9018882.1 pyridoxine 5'-phosphate synthase [Flavobacteriales bacterium]
MTRLSVNVNKIATLRNARGGNAPNVVEAAKRIQSFGAQGITVHPRPDERHIRYADVRDLKAAVRTEFNIEGYPSEGFLELVLAVKPEQVTLVPDGPNVLTSNAGWNVLAESNLLKSAIRELQEAGIRVSLFTSTDESQIEAAADIGANRIELYTEPYAVGFAGGDSDAVIPFARAAAFAHSCGLGVNAGHDLDLQNLEHFAKNVPYLSEVSIGHALISDALYLGLETTVKRYLARLKSSAFSEE